MAIGSRLARPCCHVALVALTFLSLGARSFADDQILLKSGATVSGQVSGVSGGQVSIDSHAPNGSAVRLSYDLSSIQSVTMAPPAAVANLKGATPATVISTLAPIVKEYAGLPAPWVIDAMSQLAEAYETAGQTADAEALYTQINQLYQNSPYQDAAVAGNAKIDLQQGKVNDALTLLQPLVAKADQDLAPSPTEGRFYAKAFLVYGQALEMQKQYAKALEAYLTVKTMFYQNPALVAEAEQRVAALRQQDPGVGVD